MHPPVIKVNNETYDSVYALIKDYKIVYDPLYFYTLLLKGYDPGDVVRVRVPRYIHFKGCGDTEIITLEIEILEAL